MHHHEQIEIPIAMGGGKIKQNAVLALARWSKQRARTLVLFVHGYGGDNPGTWPLFQSLLPGDARAQSLDVVFFQYDGVYDQANASASLLLDLLADLTLDPSEVVNRSLEREERPSAHKYERIVLVGHSTGAIVIRRALLDALQGPNRQAFTQADIRFVLFAPAHRGAFIAKLVSIVATGGNIFLAAPAIFAKIQSPLLDELTAGSETLTVLRSDTEAALQTGEGRHLVVAYQVIHAQKDNVVRIEPFCDDPRYVLLKNESHTSVCKPRTANEEKYARLADALFS